MLSTKHETEQKKKYKYTGVYQYMWLQDHSEIESIKAKQACKEVKKNHRTQVTIKISG
jgi:hypothetical protein